MPVTRLAVALLDFLVDANPLAYRSALRNLTHVERGVKAFSEFFFVVYLQPYFH